MAAGSQVAPVPLARARRGRVGVPRGRGTRAWAWRVRAGVGATDGPVDVGIFDSGVGGLSVAASLLRLAPAGSVRVQYAADTAFFPYGEKSEAEIRARDTRRLLRSLPPEYREAFETLEIVPPVTPEELKTHYKDMVRKLHPDLNQDDPDAEARMKAVNAAYSLVRDIIEQAD